ncbi:Zinc finger MIZ domain-containing protein [Lachnellula suecica]|uniref:Zinc finger MIZ domain-containing protein n=1 Tax=Lachnellula suecica TaxID=602035 RepID=A0A8T9C6Q7_9HELO|nr:Zinc finger MIZ domain-containing protein [Lachnellula suecica]
MRRPPDKDGHAGPSARDVVSSNETLALIGGARKKSWMTGTGTGAPVRPTPRPTPSRPVVPQVSMAQKSTAAVLPSPAPSDEPSSPVLSNSNLHRSRSHTENPQEIPADENQHSSAARHHQRAEDGLRASEADFQAGKALLQTAQSRAAFSNHPQIRTQEQLMTSPEVISSSPPRMRAGNAAIPQARTEQQQRVAPARDKPQVPDKLHDAPQRQAPRPPPISTMSQRPRDTLPGSIYSRDLSEIGAGQLPSPSQTSASSPRTAPDLPLPSTMLPQAQTYPSPRAVPAPNPNKRVRTVPPVMPPLKPRISLIKRQIESVGGLDCLNSGLERPRFQLLEDACRSEDSFYVALHQIFCIWDIPNPTQVTSIRDFPASSTLLVAFKIVGQLIRENEGLAPVHKRWFSLFPSPLPDLMRTSEPYRRTVRDVGIFLGRLASDWVQLSKDCAARRYPPLVDELVNRMGLLSPILQGVVFTAARRNLGVTDDPVGRRMEDLFKKDRQDHQKLAARYNTARPPTDREVQERNQILANEYVLLLNEHMQSRRSSGSAVSSPSTRLPTPVIPSNNFIQSGPGNTANAVPVTQSGTGLGPRQTSSPNLASIWQTTNRPQPIRVGSTSSPNIAGLAIAGRSPNAHGQPLHAGTPSPTLIQGLSMQSPVQVQQGFTPVLRSNGNSVQYQHNTPGHSPGNTHEMAYQNQNGDTRVQQTQLSSHQFQQMAAQQQQQMQHAAQQAQWQQQNAIQHQQNQQVQGQYQQQIHPQYQQQPQQGTALMQQHSQHQVQQVINMNRAAQIRRDSGSSVSPQQRAHSRNNSISSTGRRTPGTVPSNVPSPRSSRASAPNTRPEHIVRHPLDHPLVPPANMVWDRQAVNPDVTALHQALLRSPILVVPGMFPNSQSDTSRRYYQFVKGFALAPVKLPVDSPVAKFSFTVSAAELAYVARDHSTGPGKLATRELKSGVLQYRFRCIQTKPEVTICLAPDWVISDTVWPETIFPMFNLNILEMRRKTQHGKDLPIDLTPIIVAAGPNSQNIVQISIPNWRSAKMKDQGYFVAVEAIETLRHQQIMDNCLQDQRIPASQTLDAIMKSLAPANDDDDDLAIVATDLTLSLADPFTARIFVTPVRGRTCLHRECFDLETFLLTRNSKPKRPQQPCMPDVWKCPLCGQDARPYSLLVDDFLVSVRAALERQNNLDVKAILIAPDGSWRPKPEPRPQKRKDPFDHDDDTDEEEEKPSLAECARHAGPVEVIELDDD